MTALTRCDNIKCQGIYAASSAMITVLMWRRTWHFCSGECLATWAAAAAQPLWESYGAASNPENGNETDIPSDAARQ